MYLKNRDNIMKFKNGLETILRPISAKCTELQTVEWKNLNARVTMSNYMVQNFPHRVFKDLNHQLAKNIMDSSKLITKAIDDTAQFILTRRPIPDDVSNALLVAVVEHDEHFKQWERDDKPRIVGNIKGALTALIESRKLYESEPQHGKFDKVHEMGNDNALIEEFNTQVARLRKKLHALADAADIAEMEELIMQSGLFPAYSEHTNA